MTATTFPRRASLPAAVWGMAILIASEAMLFGCLIASYFYLRFTTVHWPPDGLPGPKILAPVVLTLCLVATSVPMQLASRAARAGRLAAVRTFLAGALIVQCGYLAYEVHDFAGQLARFGVSRDAYSSIYYTLLGADHGHVALGILFNVWLLGKLARGLTRYRLNAVLAITWYWHFVNVLTVVVVGTLLSARL